MKANRNTIKNLVLITLGSNSVRMSINQIDSDHTYHEVKRCREAFSLLGEKNRLSAAAFQKTEQILKKFKVIYSAYPEVKVLGVAAAALRQAKNGREFAQRLQAETGIPVRILSEVQEANGDYLGVKDQVKPAKYLIMDTGGGSTELVYVNGNKHYAASIPWGAISLSFGFGLTDVVRNENWSDAVSFIGSQLNDISWFKDVDFDTPLVLLGGAHRALARISKHLGKESQPDQIEGYEMQYDDVVDAYDYLAAMNLNEREKVPGLESRRAEVILGGLLPLYYVITRVNSENVIFSERGVRQGILNELIKQLK